MIVTHVAVGVVFNEAKQVLISLRDYSQHQGGFWEFPGGKVEAGEDVDEALSRELLEEVDITVVESSPLLTISHDYGDKQVLLEIWQVNSFTGTAKGLEGQEIKWVHINELENFQFPRANLKIIETLKSQFSIGS